MIITRFAPSPTGSLHIGGVRTALFSWLYAKKNNGKFFLRIEDTDTSRSSEKSVNVILDAMKWLGLDNDDKIYYQTNHFNRYEEVIKKLILSNKAYYCNCSKERLEELRKYQHINNLKIGYDGKCRNKNYTPKKDDIFVIRFKNPKNGSVSWNDAVKGRISILNNEFDDIIIQRSNGLPTYNFCVVIDDIDMNITHIIRGDDHVNNTPKQINIYKALNIKIPIFAHVPVILSSDGSKLSKRDNAVNIMEYRKKGYLPEALINYLVRLGWSNGNQEIFTIKEMIEAFELKYINKSPSHFDIEKLKWLNKHYIKESKFDDIKKEIYYHFSKAGLDITNGPKPHEIIKVMAGKVDTLVELVKKCSYFYNDIIYDENVVKKYIKTIKGEIFIRLLDNFLSLDMDDWKNTDILRKTVNLTAEQCKVNMSKVGMPLRIAITGSDQSPDISVTLKLLGKEKVISRLTKAIKKFDIYNK